MIGAKGDSMESSTIHGNSDEQCSKDLSKRHQDQRQIRFHVIFITSFLIPMNSTAMDAMNLHTTTSNAPSRVKTTWLIVSAVNWTNSLESTELSFATISSHISHFSTSHKCITVAATGKDPFVKLGYQNDNNVMYSQHLFAASLGTAAIEAVGKGWQAARLCSANTFKDMTLVSAAMKSSTSSVAAALTQSTLPNVDSFNATIATKGANSVVLHDQFKNKNAQLPPWAMGSTRT
ncbi:Aste57867_13538 [Aphanomyces stellatus]|uniref:Aste57867_13538 protein n=1 Tax=Aphanomyces stellatus TaxID=120398 RepID=A0A485KYQ7_9STRA|nr:hypothetical protein As57867_013488 [Aphanomyces stellatus]VFT90376.1 Aste57867_13538 [Aphanomyces stellatus]